MNGDTSAMKRNLKKKGSRLKQSHVTESRSLLKRLP
jgi:hypothetical protein